jgi:hypothetical protein
MNLPLGGIPLTRDATTIALDARLKTAMRAVNDLLDRPDMRDHQSTLGGVRATLRFLIAALPVTAAAYHDLVNIGNDIRNLYSPTRVGRYGEPNPTANLISIIDNQL